MNVMLDRQSTSFSQTARFFITLAAIGISVWFLSTYRDLFNAFFLAQLVVLTASPAMYWLRQRNMPAWLSVFVGMVMTLSVTLLIAFAIFVSAMRLIDLLPTILNNIQNFLTTTSSLGDRLGIDLSEFLDNIDPNQMVQVASVFLQGILSSISLFGLVLLILVFMVIEALTFPDKVHRQVDSGNPRFGRIFGYTKNIRDYLGITSLLGIIGGTVATLSLMLIGVDFAVLWGVLYFVMNFVPMVGFWIAMIPPLLIAWTTLGFTAALYVFLIYAVMSFVINQAVKPAMMRGGLDLSPLWSILSMIIWSSILGAPGLIIGIPLTIAIKVLVLESDPESRWIADMISADVSKEADEPQDDVPD